MANDSYTMECRIFFLVILLLGINKIEGKSEVRSSLTFVIDDTGSMGDDIAQVKQGVNKIFDTVMKSKSSQIEDFVLVTFNDPGVKLRTITKDREVFRRALSAIVVDGGDDCPENALTGIELALKRSRDSSLLYVFTDASAKDYKNFARVEALSQKKQSQIVFVLTGVCDSRNTADYLVYHKLAKATSGQVFHLGKTDIGKILKYVTTTIESRKNVIASKSYAPGYGNSFDVEVDGATKELVISVSGLNPSVEVTDSSGSAVPTEDITRLAEIAVVKVITVKPDTYKVEVGSKSGTHVIVSGTSSVHFQHGFSVLKPTSIDDTASRPMPGQKSHLSIKLSTEGGNVELKTVQILDMDDRVVLEKPLKLVDRKEEFYTTEPIDAPDHMFKIAIKGYDKESKTFLTRISLTPIKPQDPTLTASTPYQAPIVTLEEEEIDAEYDEPLQIKCKVSGYPKPNILWETDDPTEETTQTDSTIELPSKFVSVLEIRKVNKNATYTCRANNIKGTVTKSVVVKTKRKNYFTVLELPKDTTIEYAKEGQIHCKVDAFPPASFYWYKNMKPLTPDENLELSADSSTLYIHSMEPDVADNYICEARNDLERKVAPFKVSISGIEKPKIDKTINFVTTMRHSSVDIHCNLTNGKPKPTFTWLYTDQYSSTFIKLDDTSDTLHVKNVASDDTATYRCIAKNVVGEDYHDIYLIVEYPPVVTKTVSPSVVRNDGETVTLECPVDGGPTPDVVWRLNGREIRSSIRHKFFRDHSIRFTATLSDRGNYECEAKNDHGVARVKTTVEVIVPVNIEPPKRGTIEVMVGNRTVLPCRADGFPKPVLSWVFHSKDPKIPPRTFAPSDSTGSLDIPRIQLVQDGFYTCLAKNAGGSQNITYEVIVLEKPNIDKTINYVTTMRHSSVDIHCNLTNGKPKPTFTWLYTDQYSSTFIKLDDTSDTLHVKNVASDDTATYRCIAKNVVGEDYHDIYLIVEYPPVVTKTVSPSVVKNDGETVTLECPVDGGPTPDVVWRLNGREIRSSTRHKFFRDHSIRFTATLSDRGNYECEARNDHGVAHVKTTVEVIVPVEIEPPKRGTIEVMVGNRTVLPCRADGFPKPGLSWVFHSKDPKIPPSTFAPSDSTGSFDIPRIQLVQDGFYTCLAKNAGGSKNITYEVIVLAPPSITYTRKQFRAVLDDMVLRVPCKVSGNPKPEIMWMKKGFPIPAGSEWFDFAEDGSLIIKNVDELSAGNYLCHAENKVGVDYEGFDVIVEPTAYAELGYPAKTLLLKEGEPASVSCNVPHEKTDRLRWFKDGRVIAKGELEFARITSRDAGVYTCRVSSFFGAKTGTTKVVVGSEPQFIDNDENNTILEFVDGSSGVMDCSTRGELVPEIKWYHDGKTMEFNQLTYYFEMNSPSVKGKYTCVVSNEFGSAQREFVVKSLGCALDIYNDFNGNAPLMLTPLFELPKFEVTEGHVNIPREENIVLYCPTGFHKLPKKQIMVTCENDKEFSYEGIKHLYTDFKCRDKIEVKIEIAKSRCNAGNGQLMNIGFKTVTNFITVYQLCFDPIYGKTLYSKLDMQPTLANVLPNYGFNNESFPKLETIYDCNYQNNEISAILGFNFHTDGRCCFAKRQLVSPKDVAPGLSQITTFTLANVVPHWSTCNSKNWDDVEERIRMLVVSAYHELQVWTGIAEDLQMRDIDDAQKKITLPYRKTAQSVPTYLWKVVQDPASKASLAIIQVNVPDLMLLETRKYRVCNDVCGDVDWMQSSRWRNVDRGFTYCCQLSDFQRAFRSSALPSFPPYTKLLKNVAFVSEHYLHV